MELASPACSSDAGEPGKRLPPTPPFLRLLDQHSVVIATETHRFAIPLETRRSTARDALAGSAPSGTGDAPNLDRRSGATAIDGRADPADCDDSAGRETGDERLSVPC